MAMAFLPVTAKGDFESSIQTGPRLRSMIRRYEFGDRRRYPPVKGQIPVELLPSGTRVPMRTLGGNRTKTVRGA